MKNEIKMLTCDVPFCVWLVVTVGSRIIRALAIILAIFLRFDCQFSLSNKITLGTSILTRTISSA